MKNIISFLKLIFLGALAYSIGLITGNFFKFLIEG